MSGRGPTASANPRRTNEQPTVELQGKRVIAPQLPHADDYGPDVHRWWNNWVNCDQAEAFTGTDWERLIMLAPLVEEYWTTFDKGLLAEIRLNEERLGATLRDRQGLRITAKPSKDTQASEKPSEPSENVVRLQNAFTRGA